MGLTDAVVWVGLVGQVAGVAGVAARHPVERPTGAHGESQAAQPVAQAQALAPAGVAARQAPGLPLEAGRSADQRSAAGAQLAHRARPALAADHSATRALVAPVEPSAESSVARCAL